MKRYSYRFESLLNIRGIQEEEAERNFREAVLILTQCIERLEALRAEMKSLLEEIAEQRKSGTEIIVQQLFLDYIKYLNGRIDQHQKLVEEAEEQVEIRRLELVEAIKERKVLESLRIKDLQRYLLELRRWEQKVLDDLSTLRHGNEFVKDSGIIGTKMA